MRRATNSATDERELSAANTPRHSKWCWNTRKQRAEEPRNGTRGGFQQQTRGESTRVEIG